MKDIELRQIFAINLRNILREKKLTQKDFAAKIGKSGEQVSRWTTAKTSPGWEHLCLICDALSISAAELLTARQSAVIQISRQPLLNFEQDVEFSRYKQFRQFERIFSNAS